MDLQGSLVDTCLRVYPSEKLLAFLKGEDFKNSVPTNVGKLVIGDDYKQTGDVLVPKATSINLSAKDIKLLNQFTSISKDEDSNKENTEPNIDTETIDANDSKKPEESKSAQAEDSEVKNDGVYLTTSDFEWLYEYLKEKRKKIADIPYLHELLEGSHIEMPPNQLLKRNPVLEARCVKLRAQQEAREYRAMTKGVDNVRMKFPEDSISYQLKQMNRQLIAIGQFIISIFAGFLFGFRGVEWMVGNLDFGFRLLLGVMCALVIALAEIYFLAKKLNEELSVPETTQLGGPPKFADEKLYPDVLKKNSDKPHQD